MTLTRAGSAPRPNARPATTGRDGVERRHLDPIQGHISCSRRCQAEKRQVSGPASAEVMDSLVQASFTVIALPSRAAAEHDLSLTQLRVLAILRDGKPTMAVLATYLGLERSSVSGLIDRAVRRGLVRRDTSDEDGRAVRVSLTPDGQRLATLLTGEIGDLIRPMTRSLSPADAKRLSMLLNKVLE
jgi:DNA-binding MarR family transcriptional regulator